MGRIPLLVVVVVSAQLIFATTAHAAGTPSSSASPPASANSTTFGIPYTVDDPGGSGIAQVDLYVKKPGDPDFVYAQSDTAPLTHTFSFKASAGDGKYSFYTRATDNDGTEPPHLSPDGSTLVDTTPPASQATAPDSSSGGPLTISYSASDAGSGVQSVELWVKRPGTAGYTLSDTDTSPDSPSFSYGPAAGDGSYSFYTIAVDRLGNRESPPASADATTAVKSAAPATTSTTTSPPVAQLQSPEQPRSLVAAIVLQKGQTLRTVLRKGLALQLYAYREASLKLELSVSPRIAGALRMREPRVAAHNWQVITPKIYALKLRLKRSAVRRLRKMKRVRFELRSVLSSTGGSSIASNTLTFARK